MSGTGKPLDDEFDFIEDVSKQFRSYRQETLVPSGDDAGIYVPQNDQGQIVCVDTLVEQIHFKRETLSPFQIGYKGLAVNLSDIAAMGGKPTYFLVSMAIPPHWTQGELREIYRGMKTLADQWKIDLLGGDTVSAKKHLVVSVTAIGEVDRDVQLLRSNARPKDIVFVTGTLGDSAAGLHYLLAEGNSPSTEVDPPRPEDADQTWPEGEDRIISESVDRSKPENERLGDPNVELLVRAHQMPQPHLRQGQILAEWGRQARIALNDVSDGIASEALEIAAQSQADLVLKKEALPLSPELLRYAQASHKDPYEWALYGGEDFVLTGTIPAPLHDNVHKKFADAQLYFFPIGYVCAGSGHVWLEVDGEKKRLKQRGYNHFQSKKE